MKSVNKNFKNINFKHSLGQNFLIDEFIFDDIVKSSMINENDYVLEIGAGNGALTKCLASSAKIVITIEIDKNLIPILKSNLSEYNNIIIINDDFLKIDFKLIINSFEKFGFDKNFNHIKLVANLPYYITSDIVNSTLTNPYISDMTIMVQKEVGERIVASINTKNFGILTLFCNYFGVSKFLFVVSKKCFYPIPKVDSAVVRIEKYEKFIDINNKNNFMIKENKDYKNLFKLIKCSFSQRRKKLINSLSNTLKLDKEYINEVFDKMHFDKNIRAENLSLSDYEQLSKIIFVD